VDRHLVAYEAKFGAVPGAVAADGACAAGVVACAAEGGWGADDAVLHSRRNLSQAGRRVHAQGDGTLAVYTPDVLEQAKDRDCCGRCAGRRGEHVPLPAFPQTLRIDALDGRRRTRIRSTRT